MKSGKCYFAVLTLLACYTLLGNHTTTLRAQSNIFDGDTVSFFDNLMLKLANLDDKPSDLQRRRLAISRLLNLSTQEQAALATAAANYQAGLLPLQQKAIF